MYLQIRNQIDAFISEQKSCCSIGCSHCCYQIIELLDFELDVVKQAVESIDDTNRKIVLQNLEEYWEFFDKHTPNKTELNGDDVFTKFQKHSKSEKIKCPLLIDNKCSIYQNRPLACRIHIVENNPDNCKANPYRDSSDSATAFRGNMMFFLRMKRDIELRPLAYLISEIIDPKRKLKSISRIVIPKL